MRGSVPHTYRGTAAGWSQQQPDAEDDMHFCVRQKKKKKVKIKKRETVHEGKIRMMVSDSGH